MPPVGQNTSLTQGRRAAVDRRDLNPEAEKARKREWYHANKARARETNRRWQLENPERIREIAREAYARNGRPVVSPRNPEVNRRACRRWREKNIDRHKAMIADWSKRNPDARQAGSARRRARKAAGAGVSRADWQAIKVRFGHRCAYCMQPFARLTMDHVVPLARGGEHEPDNVVPACRTCNLRKHIKPASAFIAEIGGMS